MRRWWRVNGWMVWYPLVGIGFVIGVFVAAYFIAYKANS